MNAAFPCRACTWLDVQKDERKIRLISCKLNYNFVSNQKFRTSTQTAHRNAVGTPTYRCTASYSHLSNRRSPLNGRTEIYSQRIKPPQSNRPLHRYPVPGFQRVVFSIRINASAVRYCRSPTGGCVLKLNQSINLSVHCKLFALI